MHPALLFPCVLLLTLPLVGGPLDDLQSNFQTRCDFAAADRDLQLKKLDASYLTALDRQVEKIKATGKLDAVIPFINEVQAIKNAARAAGLAPPPPPSGENPAHEPARTDRSLPSDRNTETPGGYAATETPLPDLPAGASLELQQMRAKHAEARTKILKSHAEALTSLADKMVAALKSRETEFTKAGKFDDALAAKQMRDSLATNADIQAARDSMDAVAAKASNGVWRSLLNEEMEVVRKGIWDVCVVSRIQPENKTLAPFIEQLKELREKPDQILMAHSPSVVEFKLQRHATRARGKILLMNSQGSVRFKILAANKTVFEQAVEMKTEVLPFEIQFEPSKHLTLEVDSNGIDHQDWSVWLAPEIR